MFAPKKSFWFLPTDSSARVTHSGQAGRPKRHDRRGSAKNTVQLLATTGSDVVVRVAIGAGRGPGLLTLLTLCASLRSQTTGATPEAAVQAVVTDSPLL